MSDGQLLSIDELAELVQARTREQLPAARLRTAIELRRELSDTGDALIERFVAEARAAELSGSEIGQLFGTRARPGRSRYPSGAPPVSGTSTKTSSRSVSTRPATRSRR